MKKTILKTAAVAACAVAIAVSAQVFDGNHPGYPLMGPNSMTDASRLTGFNQLGMLRGSLALPNATATTLSGNCSLQATVVMTNAVQGWLTNITSGQAAIGGGTGGGMTGTNFEILTLLGCKAGDQVEFTQMVGSTGMGIVNCWTNAPQ